MAPPPPTAGAGAFAWAVADQVVVSASRFAMAWGLARWTDRESYGAYVVAFSAILVAEIAQAAIITWPFSVFGAACDGAELRRYVTAMAVTQMVVGLASAAALAAAGVALPSSWGGRELQVALAAAAAAVFFMQAQEFFRRVLLTRARPRAAFVNDAIVTALAVGGLAALHLEDGTGGAGGRWLTAGSALAVLAAASAVGLVLGAGQARTLLGRPLPDIRTYLAQNWAFGRWILGSRLGETLINQANNFIIVALSGTAAAAALDAPRLLVAPLQVVSFGLFNLLVPGETQVFEREGPPGLRRYLRRHGAAFVLLFGLYAGVVAAYPRGWLRLLYGGRYDDPLMLLLWTGAHLLLAVRVILSTVLYVTRRSDLVMHAMLGTGIVTVALTAVLAGSMAERGAAVARLCGEALLLAWIAGLVPRATSAKMGSAT